MEISGLAELCHCLVMNCASAGYIELIIDLQLEGIYSSTFTPEDKLGIEKSLCIERNDLSAMVESRINGQK